MEATAAEAECGKLETLVQVELQDAVESVFGSRTSIASGLPRPLRETHVAHTKAAPAILFPGP